MSATPTEGPILVHVVTKKGKGYAPAEAAADKYHGVQKFDVITGEQAKAPPGPPQLSERVRRARSPRRPRRDPTICRDHRGDAVGHRASTSSPRRYPDRTFDVGIAEQHAVTFAAGLAAQGMRPFCAIYSTFLQRAYDQVVHDVAIQNLPVRFAIDRAGLVGADGATHAGSFDVTYLATLPNFVVMAAADEAELVHMVHTAALHRQRPDRGALSARQRHRRGAARRRPSGSRSARAGSCARARRSRSCRSARGSAKRSRPPTRSMRKGLSTTVADLRFAKPLDEALIRKLLTTHEVAVTIEEGSDRRARRACADAGERRGADRRGPEAAHDAPARRVPGSGQAREAICRGRARRRQIVETVLKALRHNSEGVVEVSA